MPIAASSMLQTVDEGDPAPSFTASSRSAKRARPGAAAATAPSLPQRQPHCGDPAPLALPQLQLQPSQQLQASQQQQQPPRGSAAVAAELASAGTVTAAASGRTTSNVGSNLQVDRTDSSDPQPSSDADLEPGAQREVNRSDAPPPTRSSLGYALLRQRQQQQQQQRLQQEQQPQQQQQRLQQEQQPQQQQQQPAPALVQQAASALVVQPAPSAAAVAAAHALLLPRQGGGDGEGYEEGDLYEETEGSGGSSELPPAKRQRVLRTGPPPPLAPEELKVDGRDSPAPRADDEDGHYVFEVGENFTQRFKIMRKFGEGTFGRVVECWDRRRRDYVAVKIIRNIQKYRDAAMIELEVLQALERADPARAAHCVRLLEWFDYRDHVCMVFERLGLSLYDFLRRNSYKPFPLDTARSFTHQLLESVAFMHRLGLVHTDLKPENILLRATDCVKALNPPGSKLCKRLPTSNEVVVIDFGSATWETDYHSAIVCTRHYRAPEVILGLGWSFPADLWSVGCILLELVTGDALFQTHENLEHLAMMEVVLGAIPAHMAAAADDNAAAYFRNNRLDWPAGAESKKSVRAVGKLRRLRDHLRLHADPESLRPCMDTLVDLLKRLMEYEPSRRITAEEALRHPFFERAPSEQHLLLQQRLQQQQQPLQEQ